MTWRYVPGESLMVHDCGHDYRTCVCPPAPIDLEAFADREAKHMQTHRENNRE